jgi:hypothetical protein
VRSWKPLVIGIIVAAIAIATVTPVVRIARGVRPLALVEAADAVPKFERSQSAALFVGVRRFTHHDVAEVRYAADDAVDLAHRFALDPRVSLVPPDRVVLALSGSPVKPESRRRLAELQQHGARVAGADRDEILQLLEQQASLAGRGGILIVSLATHGYLREGQPHILTPESQVNDPETTLSTARLLDVVARSDARRSLVFVDACRERIDGTRAVQANVASIEPLFRRLGNSSGRAVFAATGLAYDDGKAHNGVFTKAILDGLDCHATPIGGMITTEKLSEYVQRSVSDWIRINEKPPGSGTEVLLDDDARRMPLSTCMPVPGDPARVETRGSSITVFDERGAPLWTRDAGSSVEQAAISERDVVIGTHRSLTLFDHAGATLWSVDAEDLRLRGFAIGERFRNQRQIAALWSDPRSASTRLTSHDDTGRLLGTYEQRGALLHVRIDRPTNRHVPRIVATGATSVLLLDAKKVKPVWSGHTTATIEALDVADCNHDATRDIALSTADGAKLYLDFKGRVLPQSNTAFELAPKRRGHRR